MVGGSWPRGRGVPSSYREVQNHRRAESFKRLGTRIRAKRPIKVVRSVGAALIQRWFSIAWPPLRILYLPMVAAGCGGVRWSRTFLFYGGYPGAAPLAEDHGRWVRYVRDALIETTIARDVLLLTRVDRPALLRRLFELGCRYSGQVLSYTKMLGQLQDAGNTTTLAHYLDLLASEGMWRGCPSMRAVGAARLETECRV